MKFERSAGVLLHPTSLPSKYGIGDLGDEAYRFLDFLVAGKQTLWQILPLGPTGYGDSPYQCFSAFAGNPLLISPDELVKLGFLSVDQLKNIPEYNPHSIDFGNVINYKTDLLKTAFQKYIDLGEKGSSDFTKAFSDFKHHNQFWLDDYALFMACKEQHNGQMWIHWEKELALRQPKAVKEWTKKLAHEINYQQFIQFLFFKQWNQLKKTANDRGVKIVGDLPIFVAYDSADVWANKELFTVDENGKLIWVAGVPPDYFSETGQLWGNPLYNWDKMAEDDFKWWRDRLSTIFEVVDLVRIDHFRGFEAYWRIPGNAKNAINGKWIKAPGKKLFSTIEKYLGQLPIIAEDLGVITDGVIELRDKFNFPGMKILQFAFGSKMEHKFLPHNFIKNCVVYTGSHDNETTKGYFESAKNARNQNDIFDFTQKYLNYFGEDLTGELIRIAYASVANTVVIPLQDILKFGNEARMNFPGKFGGNWTWRFTWDQVPYGIADHYKMLADMYERFPDENKTI